MSNVKTALVTGASRGIGRETAIALARKGFNVAISARTVSAGESHGDLPLPGSLEETAAEISALGQQSLVLRMDVLDQQGTAACVGKVVEHWGHLDLLVNNAIYQGQGTEVRFMDLELDDMKTLYQGNVFSQVAITRQALAHMLQRNSGCVVNMISRSGLSDPTRPVDDGGWGFAYASSKAAFHRLAGVLKVELKGTPIKVFNVDPGFVLTETLKAKGLDEALVAQFGGAPPSVIGAVIAWLASDPAAEALHGETVIAQREALKNQLHPDWRPAKD